MIPLRGWVYVMSNKAMPGLVKIGASGKDPFERAKELRGTNSPYDFVVEYDILVFFPFEVEGDVHQAMDEVREYGDGQGTEFFRCSVEYAVLTIRSIIKEVPLPEAFHKAGREYIELLEREAASHCLAEEKAKKEESLRRIQAERVQRDTEIKQAARVAAEKSEEQLREQVLCSRVRIYQDWLADQENRIYKIYAEPLVLKNSLLMLANQRLFLCTLCNRPHIFNYAKTDSFECDSCKKTIVIPNAYPSSDKI